MTKALLRKKIHKYVDLVDEKTLRLLNALLSEAIHIEEDNGTLLTPEQVKELDRRVKLYQVGEMKTQPWGKVKERILKKHKPKSK
ncbi:MAG TPA: addiction module protein [Bacteroidia bacterium]|nr:addiction module protein [Bacteroidia bacterium]